MHFLLPRSRKTSIFLTCYSWLTADNNNSTFVYILPFAEFWQWWFDEQNFHYNSHLRWKTNTQISTNSLKFVFLRFFSPFDVLSSARSVLGKGQRYQIRVSRQSPKNSRKSPNWPVRSVFLAFFFLRVRSIAIKVELDIGTTFFSYWYHMGYIGTLSSICSLLFWNVLSLFDSMRFW